MVGYISETVQDKR